MPEPTTRQLSDVGSLKALAHPLRQQLLTRLERHGSATSAELAVEFGADRGATSYHLRQLARFGFIEEDSGRSAGRRRYWRPVTQDLRLPRRAEGGTADVARRVLTGWHRAAEQALQDFLERRGRLGESGAASMHSFGTVELTAEELARFGEEYLALLERWQQAAADGPARDDRHRITVMFHAFPDVEGNQAGEPGDRNP